MTKNVSKLNFRLIDVMRAAIGLAMVDGGFVIAVQIITFLLGYFGANVQIAENQTIVGVSKGAFLVSLISMLNLSVIIFRVTGLARGVKYSPTICYARAVQRWPVLILLYLFASFTLLFAAVPIVRLLNTFNAALDPNKIIMLGMLLLIPYGFLACIFVIDQERNPWQAILAMFDVVKNRISLRLLLNIAILYSLPFSINDILMHTRIAPYTGLFTSVWFLFCHILMIVVYTGVTVVKDNEDAQKPTKVLLA